ncbi:MAG: TonB-dependent receptor [Bacteroidales bacterium]
MRKRTFFTNAMKGSLVVSSFCIFSAFTPQGNLKNIKVEIKENDLTLGDFISVVEKQTDLLFVYSKSEINTKKEIPITSGNHSLETCLNKVFGQTDITYALSNDYLVLSKNKDQSSAQDTRKVSGKITDKTGLPIIGANVVIKGTTNGIITDVDGNYTLNATPDDILLVSYIGYLSQQIKVGTQSVINVVLKEDTKTLDEVVVIGYGTQKKVDLTGSVANISADKLNVQSNANIGQALQGKIAGVDIVSQGGKPGENTRIMVRGIGTLNNSSPLYIVDGMYMSGIGHINPSDIQSIDVLKDASSAAIYGSRAANGVVIVTTKSGMDTDGKPIIDLSLNIGVSNPTKYLDMLDAAGWAQVTTVAREAIGKPVLEMASDLANKPNNDWQDLLMGPALMQNYNASIKGGGKYSTYYNSIGYLNQDGTVKGTNYQRYTIQSKSDFKKGIFSAGMNVVLSLDHGKPLHYESRGGMIGTILQTVPTLEKYDENRRGGYGGTYGDVTNLPHPLAMVDDEIMNRYNETEKINANLYAQLEIIKGLKYKINFMPDFNFYRYNYYQNAFDFGLNTSSVNQVTEEQTRTRNLLLENLLMYDRSFGKHKISALVGYTFQDTQFRYLQAYGEMLPDKIFEIDASTKNRSNKGYSTKSVLTSILARAFYSYQDKYLLTATVRRDGSSKFGKNNRYGYFPSASVGWNVSEEGFMKSLTWLDQLKIRGGYGRLGNQEIDNYQYSSTITTGINYPDGNGGLIQGAFPKQFANPDIKWEETEMTNVGLDIIALNSRLSFTADWYVKNTKDILLSVPIPISSGGANDPVRNAGKIRNKGFEFNLGWNDHLQNGITYSANFIGSFNSNKVLQMGTGSQAIWGGATNQNINTSKTVAGYPIGGFWLIPSAGYFNSDAEVDAHSKDGVKIQPSAKAGDIRFVDVNGDGAIDDSDRIYCGSPFPDVTLSLNGNISYKNFDFSIGLQGVIGNKIYNATRQTLEDVTKGTNFLASTLDYWTPDNLNASHPRLTWDDPNRNTRAESDRYLENGSYFRIRTMQLGYTIPKKVFKDAIQYARVFVSADNVWTLSNYSGYSPDVNTDSSTARGFDNFIYPNNRIFMFGVNVTF